MANPLTQVSLDLEAILKNANLFAFRTVPDSGTPPLVYVAPGDPYVSFEGASFGGQVVRHQLVAVASAGTNEVAAGELDDLALQILDAMRDIDEHFVIDVGQPGQVVINGQSHLAVPINVQTEIRR